jgi:hypothetical protein
LKDGSSAKQTMGRMKKSSAAETSKTENQAAVDYQVFVSHATADKWIAKAICEHLEDAGAVTFATTATSRVATTSRRRSGGKSRNQEKWLY